MVPLLKTAFKPALDLLLPPLCLSCGGMAGNPHGFCAACWGELHFITPPVCAACGIPFDFEVDANALCGQCMSEKPVFTAARAALSYDDASRAVILPFKNRDRTDYVPAFTRLMHSAGKNLLDASDVIVPVPLHPLRLFTRRYNQAAMLALGLGKLSKKPVRLDALMRLKATKSQGHLHRSQRKANVARAFALHPRARKSMEGQAVLLVDDVLTTGATANACAKTLLDAGAKEVRVLALARVKKAE